MPKKTKEDPTGQNSRRLSSGARLKARLASAQRKVLRLFRAVPKKRTTQTVVVNASMPVYEYNLTPEQIELFNEEIQAILDQEVVETEQDRMPPQWWWQEQVEPPYRQGIAEETTQFNQLIAEAIIAGITIRGLAPQRVPLELVLTSPAYLQALNNAYIENFNSIKTLSTRTAEQVIQRVNAGMAAGLTPTQIASDIAERFDVSKSSAQRIASTEVNKAYTDGKLNAVTMAAEQTGLRAGVIHISALLPTTRRHHAARHGLAYSVAAQSAWWSQGSNRINCKCTIRSVLINSSGEVVQKEVRDEIRQEGKNFFGS